MKKVGPSNMIHWQRVNSLTKELISARKSEKQEKQDQLELEKAQYQAEFNAVNDVINGLKTFTIISDDF